MWIKLIEATQAQDQFFNFIVTLETPRGEMRVGVSIVALVDYRQWQTEMLATTGMMYMDGRCEGREPNHANETWKFIIAGYLNKAPVAVAQGGEMVN